MGDNSSIRLYQNFSEAANHLKNKQLHSIVQTELYSNGELNNDILSFAQENHVTYGFVPGNSELFVGNIQADLYYSVPIIAVHQTALIGWGRVVKRSTDLLVGMFTLIIATPLMLFIAIAIKVTDGGPILFRHERLSRYNRKVRVFKFRSHRIAYSGLEPEAAFRKMGREDLIEKYRRMGDQLPDDPRVTKIGRFMRRYSLDELPQLINVLKGDISLVGPRALVAYELDRYPKKNLILSVRSGLTGLAQISGVRDLSFLERRKLDLYYVENWTFWGDIVILAKTFWVVIRHKGRS
jgi:lipopolysaccharide/colanic/teichoic acid biosynthesis glycosyltransferase